MSRLDERALDAAVLELVGWGILAREGGRLAWTRRFRGAVMREAARLAIAEREGRAPPGAPLAVAATAALEALRPDATLTHARLVVGTELAGLPERVRALVGPHGP